MTHIPTPNEEVIGIKGYLTNTPGIGGQLRRSIEDFVVEEILSDGTVVGIGTGLPDHHRRETEGGLYCHFVLEKRGIDHFHAIAELSNELGISKKRFSYCGTKDANAVTSQLVSIRAISPSQLTTRSRLLRVRTPFRASRPLRLGDHWGNSFRIKVTGIPLEPGEVDRLVQATSSQIDRHGGVPNFFGHQRFGTVRPNTHLVGKHLLRADFESAVWEYLTACYQGERQEVVEARQSLLETRDFKAALASFPKALSYERTILAHLAHRPGDFLGALRRIPRGLLTLLVGAYQSYIFNLALSNRIKYRDPFQPREGDVLQLDERRFVVGSSVDLDDAVRLQREGKARLVCTVVGYASGAEGPISPEVLEVMKQEKITSSLFYVRELPEVSPRGGYRDMLCPVHQLQIEPAQADGPRQASLRLSFRLRKGSYATVVLREFMKTDISRY